jgi:hypothetical protein
MSRLGPIPFGFILKDPGIKDSGLALKIGFDFVFFLFILGFIFRKAGLARCVPTTPTTWHQRNEQEQPQPTRCQQFPICGQK